MFSDPLGLSTINEAQETAMGFPNKYWQNLSNNTAGDAGIGGAHHTENTFFADGEALEELLAEGDPSDETALGGGPQVATPWRELDALTLDLLSGANSSTSGYALESAWNRWAGTSPSFLLLGYMPETFPVQYTAPEWGRKTAFDGKSMEHEIRTGRDRWSMRHTTGVAMYEVKRTVRTSLTVGYKNLGPQINVLGTRFRRTNSRGGPSYNLVTTGNVTDISSLIAYARRQDVVIRHYIAYYRMNGEGIVKIKFKARVHTVFGLDFDRDIPFSNQNGVTLRK